MNSNNRVRELRKNLGLTQADFGEKIGLKQAVIGQMEKGARNLTDRTFLLICEKYNVNEEWLRDGKGSMFIENDDTIISEAAAQYHLTGLDKMILKVFLELSPEKREVFKQFAYTLINHVLDDNALYEELLNSLGACTKTSDANTSTGVIDEKQNDDTPEKIMIFRASRSTTNAAPEILEERIDKLEKLKALPKVISDDDL